MARSLTPWMVLITSTISWALASLTRRSGPITLMEFSPLIPLMASSTLSEIICEKPKVTPGKAAASSAESSSVSFSLVIPRGHSSKGFKGAKSSMW